MDTVELLALIADVESDRVERTVATRDTDKFAEAICAFANDFPRHGKPGALVIGATNDGRVAGTAVTDQLLRDLAAIRSDGNIQPLPSMTVRKETLPGGDVAVVEVLPSDIPPVRYKGRVFIRVGPRRGIATEQEERVLAERRSSHARSFDASPCREARLADLALDLFTQTYRPQSVAQEIIDANNRDIRHQLASLRFFDIERDCPTNAGVLLFGKNPLAFLPGAYVQFVRFDGTQMTDPPRERQLSGDLLTLLRELDSLVRVQVTERPMATSMLRESARFDYPARALREILMNAVMHRSYQSNSPVRFYWFTDRIEVQSPGGLYGEATPENFPRQNAYRNPVLAEAMKALGYVNRFGVGIQAAQKALADNGNPALEFELDPHFVLFTLRACA